MPRDCHFQAQSSEEIRAQENPRLKSLLVTQLRFAKNDKAVVPLVGIGVIFVRVALAWCDDGVAHWKINQALKPVTPSGLRTLARF